MLANPTMDAILREFDSALQPLPSELDVVSEFARQLHARLPSHLETPIHVDIAGSILRKTKIRPIQDMDFVCRVHTGRCGIAQDHFAVLGKLRDAILSTGLVANAQRGDAVVSALAAGSGLRVDVVPLLVDASDAPYIRRRAKDGRYVSIPHVPERQGQATNQQDKLCQGRYRPVVRLFKGWNAGHGKPLVRSYIAETIAWHAVEPAHTLREALRATFAFATNVFEHMDFLPDPGNPEDNVLGGIRSSDRSQALATLMEAQELLNHAERCDDLASASGAWASVLTLDALAARSNISKGAPYGS